MVRGVPSPGLRFDGYNVHTNQRVLRLSLIQGNPAFTAHVLAAFKLVLPAIEPCPIAGSTLVGKYVRVTESGLSKYGTHFLLIDESRGTYQLLVKGYGKVTVLHSAADVGALLSYVEEHCYYDSIREPA
jgi:hypothetical protein